MAATPTASVLLTGAIHRTPRPFTVSVTRLPRRFRLPIRGIGTIIRSSHAAAAMKITVVAQNCQLSIGIGTRAPYASTWYTTSAATYARPLIQASCRSAHRIPPASRAVTASVGRHCIARM